jgi:two-component system nitrogen regulation response regulator GlnG
MPRVLIVDDEENVLYSFRRGLTAAGVEIVTASDGAEAIEQAQRQRLDTVILDIRLPDMSGLGVFDRLRQIDPRLPVIIVTAHATTDTAIDAMKRGAFEYLLKPVDIHRLRALVAKSIEVSRLQHVPAIFEQEDNDDTIPADRIIGRCEAMQQVYKTIGRIATENVTVLILGESGTGKELVARAIYHHSSRADKPFLAINCAALPESLLESELFGHERGAFTGADRRRIGKFEQAHGGTLFLDELGDMSLATQAKVLRALQDGRFERVGGGETIATDVRVIAATNQDLEAKIDDGEFRRDLLYRLNGFSVHLPPLRDWIEDLPLLVEHFLKLSNKQLSKRAARVSPEAMKRLRAYHWPGNVRELQSVVNFAVVHCVGDVITPDCLPESCRRDRRTNDRQAADEELRAIVQHIRRRLDAGETGIYHDLLEKVELIAVREALRHAQGNQVHASERLGVARNTLRAKIAALGLSQMDDDPA